MDPNNIDNLNINYSKQILEAVKGLGTTGKIGYYPRNKYLYIKTQDEYNLNAFGILSEEGFELAPSWNKPGGPKSHISLVNGFELDNLLLRDDANKIYKKYKDVDIGFQLNDVQFENQLDKNTQRRKIVCFLIVESKIIVGIRSELNLEETPYFKLHISLCSKLL